MERTLARDLKAHVGESVIIRGWIHKKRLLGGLNFISVRDRSGLTQALIEDKNQIEKLRGMQIGTVVAFTGNVVADDRAPGGAELHDVKVTVDIPVVDESPIEIDKPLSHKSDNLDTLFDNRVIGLRNIDETAIFRIQATVLESAREYFRSNDFTEMNTPKLLAEATEGGAETFTLDYFGKTATLAQSAQFYKQMMVGVFERVFETNPTYRAELSATTRHMSEFITIDAEMGFVSFDELREFAHQLLRYVVDHVWEKHEVELKRWNAIKPVLPDRAVSITLKEVHDLFEKHNKTVVEDKRDLTPAEEKWICDYAKKNLGTEAIFVTEWPSSEMKFYHKKMSSNPDLAERSDFLFRGVEIMTCPMREHRYNVLVEQLRDKIGASPDDPGFKYYLQAFQYGLPPHGGFGLGLERLTQRVIGLNNVKEATLFPRDINRLTP
ncbi:aspartate--tRNA(Asn) ligase [Candidatus Saccharibacteria bacterium]|nr:aspartate--tRNA(Asn) ligase [Candidatus Saccharibacteria bacterium]NCU40392.1 aspartate--tRNA(Asn) ligase [Candidatus Saccharibacteria bacterium]